MIVRNSEGKIDIGKSMDSIQKELKEVWGENPVSIKVFCSERAAQEEQCHDCEHCKNWNVDPEDLGDKYFEPLPENSCQKRHYLNDPDCIDPETAACKYWKFAEKKELPEDGEQCQQPRT